MRQNQQKRCHVVEWFYLIDLVQKIYPLNDKRPDQAVQNCLNRYQETRRRTTGHKTKKNVSGFKCNAANTTNNELCLKHVVKC